MPLSTPEGLDARAHGGVGTWKTSSPTCPLFHAPTLLPLLAAAVLLSLLCPFSVGAQPVDFGSADDPREKLHGAPWERTSRLSLRGGLSLIGPRWRAAGGVGARLATPLFTAHLLGILRSGMGGVRDADVDEWYDLLRFVRYVRYNGGPASSLYLRLGPINRMRLGTGHLVRFFNSRAAWDERTVGVEAALELPFVTLAAFTDNVFFDGVAGGEFSLRPFAALDGPRIRSFQIGVSAVTDLSFRGRTLSDSTQTIAAYSVHARLSAFNAGGIVLSPFVSYATYLHYGSGVGAGIELASRNFIDLARFRLRLALYRSSDAFLPGYVGPFYTVSNPRAYIAATRSFFEATALGASDFSASARAGRAGIPLSTVQAGTGLETELRLLVFDRMELWYHFFHYFGQQDLSSYHLRPYFRIDETLRFHFALSRAGLAGFLSLFGELDDQTLLTFGTDYRAFRNVWIHLRGRYTFERLPSADGAPRRYLPERRFAPTVGLRVAL